MIATGRESVGCKGANITFLGRKLYLERFRDDEDESLKSFAKIVQKEYKMCPARMESMEG